MPLPLEALQYVVRITSFGDLLGTGFLVRVASETGRGTYSYVVTADHVIKNQVGIQVEAPNPFDTNGALYPPLDIDDWRRLYPGVNASRVEFNGVDVGDASNLDLAWAPYVDPEERAHHAAWVHPFMKEAVPDLGNRVYYVGIFEPLMRPMARSGTVGALYQQVPHRDGYVYPAHLIDLRSYAGFSGSPVYMETPVARIDGSGVPEDVQTMAKLMNVDTSILGGMHYFTHTCGMLTAHYSDEDGAGEGVVSRYGVATALPSIYIWIAIMSEEAREERREWDKDREARRLDAEPPLQNLSAAPNSEFARFEDLAQKLVNTPKPDKEKG